MSKVYKNIRFSNLIDSETNWKSFNPTLEKGELAFVNKEGNYLMILGTGSQESMASILQNTESHANQIFYTGAGRGLTLPVATSYTLGGVKIPDSTVSGLSIDKSGALFNELIDGFDQDKNCFIIDKVHINHLTTNKEDVNTSFTGNEITLRSEAAEALQGISGVKIHNVKDKDIIFGVNGQGQFGITDINNFQFSSGMLTRGTGSGFVSPDVGGQFVSIQPFFPLIVKYSDDYSIIYSPDREMSTEDKKYFDLSPATILTNGQPATYNYDTRTYHINLDGGLTEDTALSIQKFEEHVADIEKLKQKSLFTVDPGSLLSVENRGANSITIGHSLVQQQESATSKYAYTVVKPKTTNDMKVISVLVDVETDNYGHITRKIYKQIGWIPG